MRILLLISLLSFLTLNGISEENENGKTAAKSHQVQTISGVVTDKYTGEALAGVKVQIKETGVVAYTDLDGKYQFNEVKKGIVKLRFDMVTYKTVVTNEIKLTENNKLHNQLLYPM